MKIRSVLLASVSVAFLAASVAGAAPQNLNAVLAEEAYKSLTSGDPAKAVSSYTTAIESRELGPELLANALLNRGLAHQYLNQPDLAVDDYTAAMRIDAMSGSLRAMALYNRGLAYQKQRKQAAAIEDFTSALFLDPRLSHAYYSRGNLLRETGQHLFALSDFDKALQAGHPDAAKVHYSEALTYEALGRTSNAQEALTKSLAVNPDFLPAKTRLAALSPVVDNMATATIAMAAPPELLDGEVTLVGAASPKKLYTDRVPTEDHLVEALAAAEPERIIAIEAVAEEPVVEPVAAEAVGSIEEPEAEPVVTGWSVQIASASSEDAAWSTWKKMQARHRVLAGQTASVVKADLGTKGTFYRVRFHGYDKQNEAKSACSRLKSKGVSCFVSKASS